MKPKLYISIIITILVFSSIIYSGGNKIIKHPNPYESIDTKWQWALQQSEEFENGVWIGYSINRLMSKNSTIGMHISGDDRIKYPTLDQLIYNRNLKSIESESLSDVAKKTLSELNADESEIDEKINKEIALLFYYGKNPAKHTDPEKIRISNITLHANLKNKPVIWLGICSQDESATFLVNKYSSISNNDIKEEIIVALGLHQQSKIPIVFFTSLIKSDKNNEIREEAVFWLGEHNNDGSLDLILETVRNDRSSSVREKAVFVIYQMESEKSENALIQLARNAKERNIKKEAIFWLGQKAANKSAKILEDIIESDEDSEVKEQAVFALSQLEYNEGVPSLIEIANNHPNIEVRKKAIFWLGECEDPQALEAIINLVKEN